METKLYNYKILVEPDIRTGTNQSCYTALIPTLGVASDGNTIEEAIKNVKEAGSLYLESLIEDGKGNNHRWHIHANARVILHLTNGKKVELKGGSP